MASLMTRLAYRMGFVPAPVTSRRRAFDGAAGDRLNSNWLGSHLHINDDLRMSLDALRSRSRELYQNNGIGRRFVQMTVNNVVGDRGVQLNHSVYLSNGKPDTKAQTALAVAWAAWCKFGVCDVSGRHSFADLQRGMIADLAKDGEYLVRIVRGAQAGNDFGFALQRLDPARIDTLYNRPAADGENAVVMGIEVNRYQRPVAFYIKSSIGIFGAANRERIPASEIFYGFPPVDFVEAARGTTLMFASMKALKDIGAYNEAAIINARVGASKMGFYTQTSDVLPNDNDGADGEDAEDAEGRLAQEVAAGTFEKLSPGMGFEAFDPTYPSDQYGAFVKAMLRHVASGLNVSYNTLANDLEGVNYSSIRQGVLDERDAWKSLQNWFIGAFLEPLFEEWLEWALLNGQVVSESGKVYEYSDMKRLARHTWSPRRWGWVDPLKDTQAALLKLQNGLTSRAKLAEESGVSLEEIFADLEKEKDLASEYNITVGGTQFTVPSDNDEKNE